MQEAGGGTLTVRTLFEKGNVVILFSDTGPGMRDPHLVFDPFYTTKPVGKGTGLGLSICYGLIQDQGGQISCYNRPEGGATFRVELPAVPAAFPFSPRSVTLRLATHRQNWPEPSISSNLFQGHSIHEVSAIIPGPCRDLLPIRRNQRPPLSRRGPSRSKGLSAWASPRWRGYWRTACMPGGSSIRKTIRFLPILQGKTGFGVSRADVFSD